MKAIPQDQQQRDKILSSLDRNVVIVAGAGAGKTTAIISRMIALVTTGMATPNDLAAITFTRKAAGELRNRFIDALHDAVASEDDPERKKILRTSLENSDQAFAGTIHSFCGQLLRERSFAVGLQPDFVEIDDREERILRQRYWNDYLHHKELEDDPALRTVQALKIGVDRLFQFFSEANEFRDIQLKPSKAAEPDLDRAVDSVRSFLSTLDALVPTRWEEERDPLVKAYFKAKHYQLNRTMTTTADKVEFISIVDSVDYKKIRPERWRDSAAIDKVKKTDYKEFRDQSIRPTLSLWSEYVYATLLPFIDGAVAFYEKGRLRDGLVSFDDLLFYATRLLRDSREARTYFSQKYKHLFVDEFQDTDPTQAELIFLLSGQDPDDSDWRSVTPRPGALCIVGDEKQAIYRFRRADVETFRFAAQRVRDTGGEVIELTTSFRSLGNLCSWYNSVFSGILSAEGDRYQAKYLPLEKFRPDGMDEFCVRKIVVPDVYRNLAGPIAEIEASQIAAFIDEAIAGRTDLNGSSEGSLLAEAASPGDFMILTRKNAHLSIYSKELQRRGIPFDIVGGAVIGKSTELKDLVHVLRAIYEPDNPLWILSYLRGNLNGFSDDDLYSFVKHGGRLTLYPSIPELRDDELNRRFTEAFDRLKKCGALLTNYPPVTAFEMILDLFGFLPYSASKNDGSGRAGTLLRVLDIVRNLEQGGLHWGDILSELNALLEDRQSNIFESTLQAGEQDVVRLMNVHQSKGLQARVVILADSYNAMTSRINRHVSRMSEPPYVSIQVTERKTNYDLAIAKPPNWEADKAEEALFEFAEEDRLRYVAATRAQNLLVVCVYPKGKDKGQWHPFYSKLAKVPQIEYASEILDATTSEETPSLRMLIDERDLVAERARTPSFTQTIVTDSEKDESKPDYGGPVGFGADYGTAVHHVLELHVNGKLPVDVSNYISRLCTANKAIEGFEGQLAEAIARFKQSAIARELHESASVCTEASIGYADLAKIVITRGTIDLVYKIDGGWKIVDHKSVVAKTADEQREVVARYEKQLRTYADYWESISGESVLECGIWLTEVGEYVAVNLDATLNTLDATLDTTLGL